jgi:formamidopyrimidine-DNA glycosylase
MIFRFSGDHWLGVHLGMSGELIAASPDVRAGRHDHLILRTGRSSLVFTDPRMFGRIQFHSGTEPPGWWTGIAPAVLSKDFSLAAVADFLERRRQAPVKAVLLMQERFPGIGNWMADEILWRAAIHPRRPAGSLTVAERRALWRECRHVCRLALTTIAGRGARLPRDLNVEIPESWLFRHRWRGGGRCPRTGVPLVREEIGGRTTCWSPARQRWPAGLRGTPARAIPRRKPKR